MSSGASTTPRRTLSTEERKALYQTILLMKGAGSNITEVSRNQSVSRQTADNYRRLLILHGYSLDTPRTPEEIASITEKMMSLTGVVQDPEMGVRKMEAALKKKLEKKAQEKANRKGHLKAEARLNLLSEIAETEGISPQARVTAVTKIDDIEFRSRSPESFGPPAPLSREDRIIRGMRVMECLGRDLSLESFNRMDDCHWKPPFPPLEIPHGTSTDPVHPRPKKEEEGDRNLLPQPEKADPQTLPNLPGDHHEKGSSAGSDLSIREGGHPSQEKAEICRTTLPSNRPWREADVQEKDAPQGASSHNSSEEEARPREDS